MKELSNALTAIYEKTGISPALVSAEGEFLHGASSDFENFHVDELIFADNVAQSGGLTVLKTENGSKRCYLVFAGEGESALKQAKLMEMVISLVAGEGDSAMSVEERMRLLLAGELNPVRSNMLRAYFSEVSFNHFMLSLVTRTSEMQENLKMFLQTVADKDDYIIPMDDRTIIYFRAASDEGEYKSATEFATILYENIKEELRIDLTVVTGGTIRSFHELAGSYEKVIFTYKFGKLLSPTENVYSYKDFVLIRLLADIPKPILIKYFDGLLEGNAAEVIADEELMSTADEFMKNSLNISETSRNMYIHRNTLIYRLDKIEKETGLNLRSFSDAVTLRLIKMLNTLIKGE